MRAGPSLARLGFRYGAELRIIFILIRAHARRAIVPLAEMQRGESMLPFMAACGRQTACRRSRAVTRPLVWARAALRHRLLRSVNRNPDSGQGAPWETRTASALRAEPPFGRWSFDHLQSPDFMIIRLPLREFRPFGQNRV